MHIALLIDTSNNKLIKVGLQIDGREDIVEKVPDHRKAQVILPTVEELLQKHKLKLEQISEIKVAVGPGSFTGLRVGVAIANTLGFFLKVPINGKEIGEMEEPVYV